MRRIFVFLLLVQATSTFAQNELSNTKARYESYFAKFIKFYNGAQLDSLNRMVADKWGRQEIKSMHEELGTVTSWKYIGPYKSETDVSGNLMCYFKLVFSKPAKMKPIVGFDRSGIDGKKIHAASIALGKDNKIYGMRFITSSPEIDSMIAQ